MEPIGDVLIDGEPTVAQEANLSVFDIGFQRGYGCFEVMRSYSGTVFRLDRHLTRLEASAALMHLPLPASSVLAGWVEGRAAQAEDCVVRVLVSGGTDLLSPGEGGVVIVYAEAVHPVANALRLAPLDAPWHSDGAISQLTGAKTLSYGPNLAASLAARGAGYDDALLLGRDGVVLEGPTYSVAWIIDGVIETPELSLGILDSITRGAALEVAAEAGLGVREGAYDLARLLIADEVIALSTMKEVAAVAAVGSQTWSPGRDTQRLAGEFGRLVGAETGV